MLYDISRIHFVERIDRSHFSYTYRMPYNIKPTFGVFVPKWTNWKKKRGFQVLCRFFLNFCENFLFAYDTTVAWRFEFAIIIVFVKKQKFYWGFGPENGWNGKWAIKSAFKFYEELKCVIILIFLREVTITCTKT